MANLVKIHNHAGHLYFHLTVLFDYLSQFRNLFSLTQGTLKIDRPFGFLFKSRSVKYCNFLLQTILFVVILFVK